MSALRRLAIALPTAAIAATALASSASASTALLGDANALLISGDGQGNVVTVDPLPVLPGKQLRVIDVGAALQVVGGCTLEPGFSNRADCSPVPRVAAFLGGGTDLLTVDANLPVEAYGQLGADTITGGDDADELEGNGGADVIQGDGGADHISDGERTDPAAGSGGDDHLDGGAGNDYIDGGLLPGGGAGADTLNGQGDVDTVDYSGRTAPVTVTETVGSDDGQAGEGDNVVNGEIILGGSAGDSLTGADEPNTLRGGRGDDTLDGGSGLAPDLFEGGPGTDTASYSKRVVPITANLDGEKGDGATGENDAIAYDVENLTGGYEGDHLTGSSGANALSGGPADDTLDGIGGDDSLSGDGGADKLNGASGDDTLSGGEGNDTIVGGTGSDTITCGGGDDTVSADANDTVAADCEHVSGLPAENSSHEGGGVGNPGPAADTTGPALQLPTSLKLGRKHRASARIACPVAETAGCLSIRLTVVAGGKKIGSADIKVIGGGSAKTVKLHLKGKKLPKRVNLVATAADASGNRGTTRRNAKLR